MKIPSRKEQENLGHDHKVFSPASFPHDILALKNKEREIILMSDLRGITTNFYLNLSREARKFIEIAMRF